MDYERILKLLTKAEEVTKAKIDNAPASDDKVMDYGLKLLCKSAAEMAYRDMRAMLAAEK